MQHKKHILSHSKDSSVQRQKSEILIIHISSCLLEMKLVCVWQKKRTERTRVILNKTWYWRTKWSVFVPDSSFIKLMLTRVTFFQVESNIKTLNKSHIKLIILTLNFYMNLTQGSLKCRWTGKSEGLFTLNMNVWFKLILNRNYGGIHTGQEYSLANEAMLISFALQRNADQ